MKSLARNCFVIVAALFFGAQFYSASNAQGRRGAFSHNTKAHKVGKYADCNSCHLLPERNWMSPRRDKQESFPDVTNFPYKKHATCFGCHVQDVYSNGGVFCGSCHTTASMRARAVRPFPNMANPTQFRTIFPHDVHQDIIASNPQKTDYAVAHFVSAAYLPDDQPKKPAPYYNCAVCHKTLTDIPKPAPEAKKPFQLKGVADLIEDAPLERDLQDDKSKLSFRTWLDPATDKKKQILGSFFMNSPTGHESCFSCHYQFQNLPKGKQSCAGCHELTNPFKPYFDKGAINRYSLKFSHSTGAHVKECTSCHVQITATNTLRVKDEDGKLIVEDVPIVTCKKCHLDGDAPGAAGRIIKTEVNKRKTEMTRQCSYCHTSAVGRFEIPSSHRVLVP